MNGGLGMEKDCGKKLPIVFVCWSVPGEWHGCEVLRIVMRFAAYVGERGIRLSNRKTTMARQ